MRDAIGLSLIAVAYGVVTKLGLLFLAPPENVSYFWPASGLLLALLALTPPKRWPAILLVIFPVGVALNAWGTGRGVLPSVGYAIADVFEAWPAALLLLRFGGPTLDFGSVRQVLTLVLGAAPASAVLSGAVGAAVATYVTRDANASTFFITFRTWAVSVVLSEILITPLIVTWVRKGGPRVDARELAETTLVVVLLAAVTVFVFAGPAPGGLPLFYLPFPLVFWAALRLGPRGAATASLTVAVIAVLLSVRGMTNFAPASGTAERVHWMQLLIGTMAVSALALASAVEEQRSTAARLREAEARHRLVVEAAPIGVALTSASGTIVQANPAYATILGRSVAELVGQNFAELTHVEDRKSNTELLSELVSGMRNFVSFEKRYLRPDGTAVPTQLHVAVLRDEAGRFVSTITMVVDVSQRKRLEAQLLQSQKMEAVGTLAGGIAHDFNNLLTVVLAQADAGARRARDPLLEAAFSDIADAAKRATRLTKQLLSFASKQLVEPKVVDLGSSLADLQNLLRRFIGTAIDVRFEPEPGTWPVRIDPSQLEQIIINLAVNARDAMPEGGALTIATANRSIESGSDDADPGVGPGDWALLTVSDTGVGMDESVQQHLFEPFFTTKERGKNTGLGLATVHGIVTRANGHIALTSTPGRGTTFRVWLPRTNELPSTVTRAATPIGGGKTVLVVDDDPAVRRVAAEILRAHGFVVLEASDASGALEVANSHPSEIDLLLTDVVMPGKSGRVLAEELTLARPSVRVLFTSGYAEGEVAGSPLLAKPYSSHELVATVQQTLSVAPEHQ